MVKGFSSVGNNLKTDRDDSYTTVNKLKTNEGYTSRANFAACELYFSIAVVKKKEIVIGSKLDTVEEGICELEYRSKQITKNVARGIMRWK